MQAYKVVLPLDDGRYISCIANFKNRFSTAQVEYAIDSMTVPRKSYGSLCAFDSLSHANDFIILEGLRSCKIFECEVEVDDSKTAGIFIDSYWRMLFYPKGTILCKSIKLIKEAE